MEVSGGPSVRPTGWGHVKSLQSPPTQGQGCLVEN